MNFDIFDFTTFISILSFSFFSSLHCIFMCGPLVCSVFNGCPSLKQRGLWFYNLARALSYITMGSLLGFFGEKLNTWSHSIGKALTLAVASLLLVFALKGLSFGKIMRSYPTFISQSIVNRASRKIANLPQHYRMLALGLFTVLLPCMTLTPVLAFAASSHSAVSGGLIMGAFFLGTLPALLSISILPQNRLNAISPKSFEKIAYSFLLFTAAMTFYRVWH